MADKSIEDLHHVMECTWSELNVKVGTIEEAANVVCNGAMILFDWSILIGSTSTCWLDCVTTLFEQLLHLWVLAEFTSLIHHDMFVVAFWGMCFKEHG